MKSHTYFSIMADSGAEEELTPAYDIVVTKYKTIGDIVNNALKKVVEKAVAGETVRSLCELGDSFIVEETSKIFKKIKDLKKGIAFPTCLSINNCVCHFSPLRSDPDITLKDDDVVKIDMGGHIDGFIAVVAQTIVVGASADNKVTGRKADVIQAAHTCSEAALRKIKPGVQNYDITKLFQTISESFECKPVQGMLSHQLKQNTIDGEKSIIQNPTDDQRKDHKVSEVEVHEVYAIDVLVTTGEGKVKERDTRTTVFKKTDSAYNLKMKASRVLFSQVESKFQSMPFTLRAFEEEGKARMGVVECASHKLLEPYPVLYEKEGELVAQFKFTVLVMPTGSLRITQGVHHPEFYKTQYSVKDPEIKALLQLSANRKAAKKKRKKAASKAADAAEAVEDAEAPELVDESK
ncbi:proliferation-associated protein 2G4-like [Acanthaster planci]|uniref:Proliferation-associated protein 2G4-like n=1 Tax=Acanthaster planci TaxID=133434 RepID=A0A8B7XEZ0_ACAPL|nr:proliferation-associated protein 2G4-like [Acanthaster planci]